MLLEKPIPTPVYTVAWEVASTIDSLTDCGLREKLENLEGDLCNRDYVNRIIESMELQGGRKFGKHERRLIFSDLLQKERERDEKVMASRAKLYEEMKREYPYL